MLSSLLPFGEQDHTQTSHDPCGRWVHVCRETNRVCSHTCESEVAFSSQILTFTMSCRYPRDKSLWQLGLVFSPAACFLLLKPQFFLILLFLFYVYLFMFLRSGLRLAANLLWLSRNWNLPSRLRLFCAGITGTTPPPPT